MKSTGSRWLWLAGCSVAMLCAVVCGSAGTMGGELDRIAETGMFRLGLRNDVRPFAYVDEDGRPVGFCVDMAQLLALKLSEYADRTIDTVIVPITSTDRLERVASGDAAIEMGASTHNAVRDLVVDFSLPYFLSGTTFVVRAGEGIDALTDLAGKVVCATDGTTNLPALEAAAADGRLAPASIAVSQSHAQGMAWLDEGRIDAYFTDTVLLLAMRAEAARPDDYVIVQESIHAEPYGWILPEDDSDWRDFVDGFLIWTLQASCADEMVVLESLGILTAAPGSPGSVFDAVYDKWFGPESSTPVARSGEFDALLSAMQWPDVLDVWPGRHE